MISIQARATSGLRATLSDKGLLNVFLGNRVVAEGTFTALDGAGDFKLTSAPLGPPAATRIERISDTSLSLETDFAHARLSATFVLAGEDLTITTVLTNRHPFGSGGGGIGGGPVLRCVKLGGLVTKFDKQPAGRIAAWHNSFTQHHGLNVMHPGELAPLGAAYLFDAVSPAPLGVGIHVPSHTRQRKLIWADFDGAYPNQIPLAPRIWVVTADDIPPQCAAQTIISYRFSTETNWKYLLGPYRAELASEPLAYEPDDRPVGRFAAVNGSKVTLDNPFGFNGESRRFDRLDGIDAFLKMTALPLAKAGALGCLFWAIQGENARGAMYRPDFDIFPPQIEGLLPLLVKGFKSRGLRVGLATRPGETVERLNWKEDTTVRIRAGAREHIDRTIARFKWATDRGFDLFYLDSFGNSFDDYLIMRDLRAALGPKVLCWAEWASDIMLPLAGRYSEWQETDLVLHSHELADIYRWLVPGASYLVYDRATGQPGTRPALTPQQYADHRYTPLLEDYQLAARAADLTQIRERSLSSNRWTPK